MKKQVKKSLALFLSLLMLITAAPLTAGATEDYIEIYTKEDLNDIRNNLDGNYILMNDIIFSSSDFAYNGDFYNDGNGWMPIGIASNNASYYPKLETSEFTGTLDGNGYSVRNLEFDRATADHSYNELPYYGFIAINNGTIKNLSITVNFTLTNDSRGCGFGGICGWNKSTITNCHTHGTMFIDKTYETGDCGIGGITGAHSGTISRCSNNIDISGNNESSSPYLNIGGIAGAAMSEKNTTVTISECYNTGDITPYTESRGYLGGILGRCDFDGYFQDGFKVRINNCYNAGSIGRDDIEGKIAGITAEAGYISVENCYNVGTITAADGDTGAIWDYTYSDYKKENCYCLADCADKCNGTVLQRKQMMFKENFAGFDFENTWIVDPSTGYSYPQLRNNHQSTATPEEHNFSTSEIIKHTSCAETGTERFYCADCDAYFDFIISKLPHEYTANSVVTAPTCTSNGYTSYYCICGDYYRTDYVAKLKHEYTAEITTPATHLTEGVKTFSCECGASYTESIEKLPGHTYTSTITKYPTHLEYGERVYTCECGYSYKQLISKTQTHTYNITTVTPPTCTKKGYTMYTCACGAQYNSDFTPATGHSYTSEITRHATHTEYGEKTFSCIYCDDSYTEDIAKTPEHEYTVTDIVESNCITFPGYSVYTCECGAYYYDDYTYDYNHINEDGDYFCDNCGEFTVYCSCNCHNENGFIAFFWKILNFFQKLFGTNPVCECGMAHY